MRILHVATEMFPFVKVGGLGDVLGALPRAQRALGADARVMLPGFPAVHDALKAHHLAAVIPDLLGSGEARILLAKTVDGVPIYVLDAPSLFVRTGGPYEERGDSHLRFAALSWAAARLSMDGDRDGWHPQVVHCHDWQAALTPVYLSLETGPRPATVQAIHNLAYQGIYGREHLEALRLPPETFHPGGVEFFGNINFLKAGLAYADKITTVSPTYAREIREPAEGYGLEGLLSHRSRDLVGILNGVDAKVWDPAHSPHLEVHYGARRLSGRKVNKNLLQRSVGLMEDGRTPLFAVVSRLAEQKGLDLVLENVAYLIQLEAQLLVLGTGSPALEAGFRRAAERHPGRVATCIGFDEAMAHRILAGADVVLVPSRFEPCGLTQLYALRYGAIPLVRRTGGLADTVVDTNSMTLLSSSATGFVFKDATSWVLGETIGRACRLYREDPKAWTQVQRQGMAMDFGWDRSARQYLDLFEGLVAAPPTHGA